MVKIGQKHRELYMKTEVRCTVAGDIKSPFLTATRSATMQKESIVAFTREKWLRERATTLRYTYIAYLVCNSLSQFIQLLWMTQNGATKTNKMNPLTVK